MRMLFPGGKMRPSTAGRDACRHIIRRTYGFRRMASRQAAGTHLSAMTQKSLQGGKPVYSTSLSKLRPPGKRLPNSQALIVAAATPKSREIFLRGMPFFSRHARKAVAKLPHTSHWKSSFSTTTEGWLLPGW